MTKPTEPNPNRDISRPKFVMLLELIQEGQKDIKELKEGLLGSQYHGGLKKDVQKNTLFRKIATRGSFIMGGAIGMYCAIYPNTAAKFFKFLFL